MGHPVGFPSLISESNAQKGSTAKVDVFRNRGKEQSRGRSGLFSGSDWEEVEMDGREHRESTSEEEYVEESNDDPDDGSEPL